MVDQQPIHLQESAEVLELLFQFVHPRSEDVQYHQPRVMEIEEKLFFLMAEAAEKYIVYSAMGVCATRMH